jgi:hypothetical protein
MSQRVLYQLQEKLEKYNIPELLTINPINLVVMD